MDMRKRTEGGYQCTAASVVGFINQSSNMPVFDRAAVLASSITELSLILTPPATSAVRASHMPLQGPREPSLRADQDAYSVADRDKSIPWSSPAF